ncbi:MAG: acyl-CoA dehydrogenase family protein [Pseudomonadales bacterium]|jgi:alkylation response protein AidB-like acyl-CoA dehydrogenase|nr:acyl-CoA dehydrogenase family protein [Pseudomonadales bacterium]
MNFEFSDDQNMLREQAQGFLRDHCDSRRVRAVLEGDDPYDAGLWKGIVDLGWTATTIPEAYGGIGLGHLELCVIAEELGRCLAPTPFSSSVYLATEALLQFGSDAQKQQYLPKLAAGELIGTVAVGEGTRTVTQKNIETAAKGATVTGTKIPVPDGDVADFCILIARDSETASSLYLVDLAGAGVTRETVKTLDPTRSHAKIVFDGAPAELLGAPGAGWTQLEKLFDRAAVLFAWEQVGGAEAALHMARDYAMGRYAFGRPIASFQAIKHKLADMYIAQTLARSNCYYGAWALSTNAPELPVAAATARVSATEAFHECSKENIQTHGGMGFTWEFDCHLFYRRSKLLSVNLGALPRWKDMLVTRLEHSNQ